MDGQDQSRASALGPIIFFAILVLLILCLKPRRRHNIVDEEAGKRSKWPTKRGYMGLHGAMATDAMVHHGIGYGTLVGNHSHNHHHHDSHQSQEHQIHHTVC